MSVTALKATMNATITVPAQSLINALRFVVPAMGDKLSPLNAVWIKAGPVWCGYNSDWEPQWDSTVHGITVVSTDRYRLHIAGVVTEGPVEFSGSIALDGDDLKRALKAAPKPARYAPLGDAQIDVDDSRATLAWPNGASMPIAIGDTQMPRVEPILDVHLNAEDPDPETGFKPKFLSDALLAFGNPQLPVRMRLPRKRRPAVLASMDSDVNWAALVMPTVKHDR